MIYLKLHTHTNIFNCDLSSDIHTVNKQLYRTSLVQKLVNFVLLYTNLLKNGLNSNKIV